MLSQSLWFAVHWMPLNIGELLIDFCKLIGEHSGDNLAHAVYETLSSFDLKGRVCQSVYLPMHILIISVDHGYQQQQRI